MEQSKFKRGKLLILYYYQKETLDKRLTFNNQNSIPCMNFESKVVNSNYQRNIIISYRLNVIRIIQIISITGSEIKLKH